MLPEERSHAISNAALVSIPVFTPGVFNVATKLNDLIDKRKRREAAAALAAAKEAGDGDSDLDNAVDEDA
jgi:hypothetical protein